MRFSTYFSRYINSLTTWTSTNTCDLARSIPTLKVNLVTKRIRRSLLSRGYKLSAVMQYDTEQSKTTWDPFQIFHCPAHQKYAVIILNRPINLKHNILFQIWEKAQVTVTVDGGTNRWLKYLEDQGINVLTGEHEKYVPDFITGDMDSVPPMLVEKLKGLGSIVVETLDQNHTDYTKALLNLAQYMKLQNINLNAIYVIIDTAGRFDHIIGNINTLYKSEKLVGRIPVIQVESNSLTWLLRAGFHSITIPEILVKNQSWCGLLPFGSPANHITTTGLKWNLNNATTQFGGMVSTSNTYDNCSEVTIHTDAPIIWTMGIEPLKATTNNYET